MHSCWGLAAGLSYRHRRLCCCLGIGDGIIELRTLIPPTSCIVVYISRNAHNDAQQQLLLVMCRLTSMHMTVLQLMPTRCSKSYTGSPTPQSSSCGKS